MSRSSAHPRSGNPDGFSGRVEVTLSLYEPDRWPELMSPAQVATLLNIAPATVGRWCEDGRIEAVKIGRVWRIPREAVWPLVDSPSIRARWPQGPWTERRGES